jgi:phage terminase large subunit
VRFAVIEDKNNHCWDGIRYGLDGYIKRKPQSPG